MAKSYGDMTLDDVRALIKEVREEGLKIQSHYIRLEREYSDWEDRVNELDKIITQAEKDTGLSKEEIYKQPSPFNDLILDNDIDFSTDEGIIVDDINLL